MTFLKDAEKISVTVFIHIAHKQKRRSTNRTTPKIYEKNYASNTSKP